MRNSFEQYCDLREEDQSTPKPTEPKVDKVQMKQDDARLKYECNQIASALFREIDDHAESFLAQYGVPQTVADQVFRDKALIENMGRKLMEYMKSTGSTLKQAELPATPFATSA